MSNPSPAYLNCIATAVPVHEAHSSFVASLPHWIKSQTTLDRLRSIIDKSGIERRYSVLSHPFGPAGSGAFYTYGNFPTTGRRMEMYRQEALPLALRAASKLPAEEIQKVTHLIITTCTGFYAPGLDVDLVRELALSPRVKRTMLGFMGCFAAATGLRQAREIVLGDPTATVLMVNVELCSLHLQETEVFDRLVSFLLFGDGAAASIISSAPQGMRLDDCYSHLSLEDADRMGWFIEDQGFGMVLDVRVPANIRNFIQRNPEAVGSAGLIEDDQKLWAVHPGGKSIVDAVQNACNLTDAQVANSREVLRNYGNMSSATLMFALQHLMESADEIERTGHAIAFGPGLTLEGMDFTRLPRDHTA